MGANQVVVDAVVIQIDPLRFTPAGIEVLDFKLRHESQQLENGVTRKVELEIDAVAMGEIAKCAGRLQQGQKIRAQGFLAKKGHQSSRILLHINEIEVER